MREVMSCAHIRRVEKTRRSYKPELVSTLFIGESAPVGGKFFYFGNSGMTTYMKKAVESAFGPCDGDFLERFKSFCWYLDDLVLFPVNGLARPERMARCRTAQSSLTRRIKNYQPKAIVTLLLSIQGIVNDAADAADCGAYRYAVPFPGMGQQQLFLEAMARILKKLPRCD